MTEMLIKQYISRMTFKDIDDFARQYGIVLKNNEIEILYNHIKSDWRTILYGNPRGILDNVRNEIDPLTYSKIEQLYIYFKDKYKDYL
jgi:hypothetical protein